MTERGKNIAAGIFSVVTIAAALVLTQIYMADARQIDTMPIDPTRIAAEHEATISAYSTQIADLEATVSAQATTIAWLSAPATPQASPVSSLPSVSAEQPVSTEFSVEALTYKAEVSCAGTAENVQIVVQSAPGHEQQIFEWLVEGKTAPFVEQRLVSFDIAGEVVAYLLHADGAHVSCSIRLSQ